MQYTYAQYANVFRALSDETRLQIVALLCAKEHCGCHLLEHFNITQPTLSYHMKILLKAQIVHSYKKGRWVHYSLIEENTAMIRCFIKDVQASLVELCTNP